MAKTIKNAIKATKQMGKCKKHSWVYIKDTKLNLPSDMNPNYAIWKCKYCPMYDLRENKEKV